MNHLGRYLKKRLNELKMSEREISAKCGISHSYLNQLIKGINPSTKKRISPTLSTFEKLSEGFGIPIDQLQKISRGIKEESEAGNGYYYSPTLLNQIKDFQEFMLETLFSRETTSEEEWSRLISRIKETVKTQVKDLRK